MGIRSSSKYDHYLASAGPYVSICIQKFPFVSMYWKAPHGNPMSLVFEPYHCAKGKSSSINKTNTHEKPDCFSPKNTTLQQLTDFDLKLAPKKTSQESRSTSRPITSHSTALCYTRLPLPLAVFPWAQETLGRSSEMAGGFSMSAKMFEKQLATRTLKTYMV